MPSAILILSIQVGWGLRASAKARVRARGREQGWVGNVFRAQCYGQEAAVQQGRKERSSGREVNKWGEDEASQSVEDGGD